MKKLQRAYLPVPSLLYNNVTIIGLSGADGLRLGGREQDAGHYGGRNVDSCCVLRACCVRAARLLPACCATAATKKCAIFQKICLSAGQKLSGRKKAISRVVIDIFTSNFDTALKLCTIFLWI